MPTFFPLPRSFPLGGTWPGVSHPQDMSCVSCASFCPRTEVQILPAGFRSESLNDGTWLFWVISHSSLCGLLHQGAQLDFQPTGCCTQFTGCCFRLRLRAAAARLAAARAQSLRLFAQRRCRRRLRRRFGGLFDDLLSLLLT